MTNTQVINGKSPDLRIYRQFLAAGAYNKGFWASVDVYHYSLYQGPDNKCDEWYESIIHSG